MLTSTFYCPVSRAPAPRGPVNPGGIRCRRAAIAAGGESPRRGICGRGLTHPDGKLTESDTKETFCFPPELSLKPRNLAPVNHPAAIKILHTNHPNRGLRINALIRRNLIRTCVTATHARISYTSLPLPLRFGTCCFY